MALTIRMLKLGKVVNPWIWSLMDDVYFHGSRHWGNEAVRRETRSTSAATSSGALGKTSMAISVRFSRCSLMHLMHLMHRGDTGDRRILERRRKREESESATGVAQKCHIS